MVKKTMNQMTLLAALRRSESPFPVSNAEQKIRNSIRRMITFFLGGEPSIQLRYEDILDFPLFSRLCRSSALYPAELQKPMLSYYKSFVWEAQAEQGGSWHMHIETLGNDITSCLTSGRRKFLSTLSRKNAGRLHAFASTWSMTTNPI